MSKPERRGCNLMNFEGAAIAGAIEVPYRRKAIGVTTVSLLADAFFALLDDAGCDAARIDGLAVSSFTLKPDHAIDVAWRLGISPRWIMEDTNGGASGIKMLQHAARAVPCGGGSAIAILARDQFSGSEFNHLADHYYSTVRRVFAPLAVAGPAAPPSF